MLLVLYWVLMSSPVPDHVVVKIVDELVDALVLVVLVVVELLFESAEEPLGGRIVGAAALGAMGRISPCFSQMPIHSGRRQWPPRSEWMIEASSFLRVAHACLSMLLASSAVGRCRCSGPRAPRRSSR